MKSYFSNEEFFQAVRSLAERMEHGGHTEAARELRDGFACLNGLTDGWAMLMESVDKVIAAHGKALSPGDTAELKEMSRAIGKIVRR
ncbi:MAG: hypothetical protein HY804_14030 [Nitrospinae bacterium]|nr:hypothetical protein [Nitrospinota bacterium]